ncbi:uncharacterized protein METZ01_LOCUS85069 [marine metagenome]|uniref:MotA/TolQ/ExbB proton channel domain-containing protein n=1 Tax=marine metagenome TaxID=408172 RepID=A0A381UVQ7_9ZZZZ|tara:strand:- start:267 stop:692 length:426 start_codon:yes stop_codon:yes gene_type:complete
MIKSIGGKKKIVSEINITPLVDTLLVLLIIFMVTAPAMTRSVGIDLPTPKQDSKAQAEKAPQEKPNFVVVGLNKEENYVFEEIEYAQEDFFEKFPGLIEGIEPEKIFLHIDKKVFYEQIIELMTFLQNQGHNKIGLVFQEK